VHGLVANAEIQRADCRLDHGAAVVHFSQDPVGLVAAVCVDRLRRPPAPASRKSGSSWPGQDLITLGQEPSHHYPVCRLASSLLRAGGMAPDLTCPRTLLAWGRLF
jgi:hypothetical protein